MGARNSWRLATTGVLNEIKILTNGNLVCSRVWNIKVISDLAQLEACSAHNRKDPGSKPGVAIEENYIWFQTANFHAFKPVVVGSKPTIVIHNVAQRKSAVERNQHYFNISNLVFEILMGRIDKMINYATKFIPYCFFIIIFKCKIS